MSRELINLNTTLTLDLETTTHTHNKRKASPFSPKNWVVAAGYQHASEAPFTNYFSDREGFKHHLIPIKPETQILIGFNIKFDLLYMWSKREVSEFFRRGGRIWDCQYVHYLLCGMSQSSHMASMDSITEEYGGTLKIDEVKALWEDGVDTPDIPADLLTDYLEGDISNTYKIFTEQYKQAQEIHPHFLTMVLNRMGGLLATTEMEYRGLKIDEKVGEQDRDRLQTEYECCIGELNQRLPELPQGFEFNWKSNYHRSYLLFGGMAKYKCWTPKLDQYGQQVFTQKIEKEMVYEQAGDSILEELIPYRYKSGKKKGEIKYTNVKVNDLTKPKGRIEEFFQSFEGITKPKEEWETALKDAAGDPIYRTSADVIEELGQRDIPMLKLMADAQKIGKDLTTYYWSEDKNGNRKGMLTLVTTDGRIHHKLNHTSTVTGRLSSSDPNMQNIPRGDKSLAKRMFVSRFGDNGRIIEIDYSQLEVIVQGVLSRDKQLCRDIREGVDFHVKRLSAATNESYNDLKSRHISGDESVIAQRTAIKGFTFQRAYGAGAAAISASTGMSEGEVRNLIEAEEMLYPGISRFDASVQQSIDRTTRTTNESVYIPQIDCTLKRKEGEWFCPTGTRYVWKQQVAPEWMAAHKTYLSFSPTERKNYPVQGLGGEVVQTVLGELFYFFSKNKNYDDRAFLINTVHDCVLIDAHVDVVDSLIPIVKMIMEAIPTILKRDFDMDVDVPFPVEVETGLNWYDMEHYETKH